MNCQNFREILDSYLCDELLTETNHEVLRHLEMCAGCRAEIEIRRNLRSRVKSVVRHSPQFQISDQFSFRLRNQLKQHAFSKPQTERTFLMNRNWMAIAACLVFAFGFGLWFLQNQSKEIFSPETARLNERAQTISFDKTALGDHQNCAIKYNLTEKPVNIDLQSSEYADLRETVLMPLQNASEKYELHESHTCKYQGTHYTHIVFLHQNKVVSVLMTDLPANQALLNTGEIAAISENNYQLAHFDFANRAVFVASDLSEQENTATAEILSNSMKTQIAHNLQAKVKFQNQSAFNIAYIY